MGRSLPKTALWLWCAKNEPILTSFFSFNEESCLQLLQQKGYYCVTTTTKRPFGHGRYLALARRPKSLGRPPSSSWICPNVPVGYGSPPHLRRVDQQPSAAPLILDRPSRLSPWLPVLAIYPRSTHILTGDPKLYRGRNPAGVVWLSRLQTLKLVPA